ncbi:undecaprenyldiphospho-muramoylpentapeptide beta-N-acetylglucosaminyltransferase [Neptuniibacter caesariensis]|uniref:UDP-N-acetylglucosamine--N-acetylmuramyl-(pentapeptide) pyrophosphoryl-undecaprenol N-acetylglucosamine transferase n=1 Tax=Neptuniibacter caesariensis TaxID=207954 RepID=A0A7U8C1C6_NEPCE|nr:undecaprenyldiphospho-muramoylpentapeptide beta-N-acetylglucosaminyltransferase [Neptuniibacter caesariensis]EAR59717.1 UDP-N-acetylglucosamine--N-acetylmuramyl-(pentapeptide) pyrophosphoryl-undecaprenol N-acetylglucosamine [Oceanospirillum sp. MED92] [Neptuniibacter caesariensis]
MNRQDKVALVMAGGTGGHIFPALATAEKMQEQGVHVEWLGSSNSMESELIPKTDIRFHAIDIKGLRGKGKLSLLLAPFKLLLALVQALKVLRQVKPDVVLGMGGFASGPGGLAAWLLRVPLVVHEQNAVAGMTNKLSSRMAKYVLEAFEGAFKGTVQARSVGNPVRGAILGVDDPESRFSERTGPIRLLAVGGSLGAKAINDLLPEVLADIPEEDRPEVWHQTGKRNIQETEKRYQELGVEGCRVVPFIEAMDEAYEWADIVLCRAGALTVSELSIAGVASVLVPFPFAVDDHQTANGRYLADHDAAVLIQQSELDRDLLKELLTEKLNQRETLITMANKARSLGKPEASDTVANICLEAMK